MKKSDNVSIITTTDEREIVTWFKRAAAPTLHITNGVYNRPRDLVLPTTVTGFQFLMDVDAQPDTAIVVAINSDISVAADMAAKGATPAQIAAEEDFKTRAAKLWPALSAQFPKRQVIILSYDKATPEDLYNALAQWRPEHLRSLHKWGYGIEGKDEGEKAAREIKGAEYFQRTYAFPLPKQTDHLKPVFWDSTPSVTGARYHTADLMVTKGPHGAADITHDNRLLYPVASPLKAYSAPKSGARNAAGMKPSNPGIS